MHLTATFTKLWSILYNGNFDSRVELQVRSFLVNTTLESLKIIVEHLLDRPQNLLPKDLTPDTLWISKVPFITKKIVVCSQSYKCFMIVNYNCRVIHRYLPIRNFPVSVSIYNIGHTVYLSAQPATKNMLLGSLVLNDTKAFFFAMSQNK